VNVVIAGGGTAGHVFPAIALADRLATDHGAEVRLLGSATGQEAALVPAAGFVFHAIRAIPAQRRVSLGAVRAGLVALRSVRSCLPLVRGADTVVGMGGFASASAVLAARRARVPYVLHEQNAVPGLVNRLLAKNARSIAVSFADARTRFGPRVPTVVTGNPVRASILAVPASRESLAKEAWDALNLEPDRVTVVVFGGSQGALHVDRTIAAALPGLRHRGDLQLLVLTGRGHEEVVAGPAREPGPLVVRVLPFLHRMELAYAVADLVVGRAGATSIAELTVCGLPSLLIPYPHATEDHQTANARELQREGAAGVLFDEELSPERLIDRIVGLVDDRDRLRIMGERAAAWAKPDAAERLAAMVADVARAAER
jgi:UDP-N-acetylglucosamine--N-acetylmuramyl-(pentapeptide) pyrophosphoryl-undecaprenol N-acetylglucosamine transferase